MKTIAWIVLVAILFISTFGLSFCIVFFAAVIIFFVGSVVNKFVHPPTIVETIYVSNLISRGTSYIHIHEEQFAETYADKIINFSYATNCLRKVGEKYALFM